MDSWKTVKLGDIATLITSGSRGWAAYYADDGAKFIRMTNLPRHGINLKLDDMKYVKLPGNNSEGSRTRLQEGDVLISITAELGKIGYIPAGIGEAYINQHVALVRLNKDKVAPKMIAYILSITSVRNSLNRRNDSGAKAGLNLPTLQNFLIHIPDLEQQGNIVSILETWDLYIEKLDKKILAKENIKRSLTKSLLSGKIRLPGFDNTWKAVSFDELFKTLQKPKGMKSEVYQTDGSLPIIDQSRHKYQNGFTNDVNYQYDYTDDPVILFGDHSRVVKYINEKVAFGNDGIKLLKPKENLNPRYGYYLLSDYRIPNTGYNRHFKYLVDAEFEIPEHGEQLAIVRLLDTISNTIEAQKIIKRKIEAQKEYLLNKLVTGKLGSDEGFTVARKVEYA
jgi:type I restriction enzyme S subunit